MFVFKTTKKGRTHTLIGEGGEKKRIEKSTQRVHSSKDEARKINLLECSLTLSPCPLKSDIGRFTSKFNRHNTLHGERKEKGKITEIQQK